MAEDAGITVAGALLFPPSEDNDGRCRCGQLAVNVAAQTRCGWHASVAVHRLQRLYAADRALPVGHELPWPLADELRQLSANIEGVPAANRVEVGEATPGGMTCTGAGMLPQPERVDHPPHYGGADNPYEAIKVIEAWDLGFRLGNCVKYLSRAGRKGSRLEDLKKARWYLDREIANLEAR